jgi:hypothetical protein
MWAGLQAIFFRPKRSPWGIKMEGIDTRRVPKEIQL